MELEGVDARPYDGLMLLSFGGPNQPEDVVPFMENVTRGRGIPPERLVEVGQHYFGFGGKSPINEENLALLAAIRADFDDHGLDLPIYWGNRNWDPYLSDALAQAAADGVTRLAVFCTSAYSSYSSCRQYRENLAAADQEVPGAPTMDKLRLYFNHPGFIEPVVDQVLAAIQDLPEDARPGARLVFVTHSIPVPMSRASGPQADVDAYLTQHRDAVEVVAERVRAQTGHPHSHDLVFCSRSGAPGMPWLEPDINDHLEQLSQSGVGSVVMIPIGFVSDHMEVVYDLDTEAQATCARLGIQARRAGTPSRDPRFAAMVRDLLLERATAERGEPVARASEGLLGPTWDRCAATCCLNSRDPDRPALCGQVPGR